MGSASPASPSAREFDLLLPLRSGGSLENPYPIYSVIRTVRPVLEAAGVQDILTKTLGTNNPHNVLKATMDAFRKLRRLQDIHLVRRRSVDGGAQQEAAGGKEA